MFALKIALLSLEERTELLCVPKEREQQIIYSQGPDGTERAHACSITVPARRVGQRV